MRQRKVKNLEEKLENYTDLLIRDPGSRKGKWSSEFGDEKPVHLEIGCGRGGFITKLAVSEPGINYVGVEGQKSVALRALQNVKEQGLENIRIVAEYLNEPEEWFAPCEISGIYLNFSDPWPKDRHAKRRLTAAGYLEHYKKILKPGSFIEVKTDNNALFEFSVESIKDAGLEILEITRDLHKSALAARMIKTEYEEKFSGEGLKINYLKAVVY